MDKRSHMLILVVLIGVPLFIWIQFFEVPNKVKIGEEKMQQDPLTHNFEKVTSFENPYMGDASNMGGLFSALPLNNYRGPLEMDAEKFSVIVEYNLDVDVSTETVKQAVVYNTTAAFTLIGNLQEIKLLFGDESYIVTRENVEKWFGTTLVDFKDPKIFKEKVQQKLTDDINKWVSAYTEGE
ncbi:DUF4825 domain-containing protein [Sporosarcina jiandibaonis]|uniref:DUF4825 domain-containing protein n=1 Tax=Sporosarcina jiandibaonis TaxID=2715535 RepID=UPI001553DC5A|nr:DUF4825 domain-containing protein [Sporosarcina jiandibaonis]